ncbi:hypothetical protein [Streptomyces sp. NBC_01803]|uniref:hypothetical protein n=1 Tax=Streptomyces sp. NBC_01803 TaxID=2975946 RepID=UPI002DDB4515|nr:hypothetical protein [Streptomyces sp. NBC_01803]WSA44255.1 hypothetical protein OIE51_08565 [Streptomyces sp. NBC_01803]
MNGKDPQSQPLTPDLPPPVDVPDVERSEEEIGEVPADERDRDDGGEPVAPEPPD